MKNFTSSSARFVVIVFVALVTFSLAAFAAKGPCVFRGMSETNSEDYQYDKDGNQIGCVVTTTEKSNGFYCAGLNEEECETFYDPEAIKATIVGCTYSLIEGEMVMINALTETIQGDTRAYLLLLWSPIFTATG